MASALLKTRLIEVVVHVPNIESYLTKLNLSSGHQPWLTIIEVLRKCLGSYQSARTVHVHVVGPAKAGKSLAVK